MTNPPFGSAIPITDRGILDVVKEEAETVTRNGRTVTRTLRRREKIVDDDLPEIAERYRAFRREHPEPC